MAAVDPPTYLTVPARAKHTATVIFIHGLGDSSHSWKPAAETFANNIALHHVKWVLPLAPSILLTGNMGRVMPAWYDIPSFDLNIDDEEGMLKTVRSLSHLIAGEIDRGIPAERIVLGGFSQGGTISLLTGLTISRELGGIVVLSGRLPLRDKFKSMASKHVKRLPLFWGHGRNDPLVKFALAEASVEYLKSQIGILAARVDASGVPSQSARPIGLTFHDYPGMKHSVCEEELDTLQVWLSEVVPLEP